ncbi:unnamed protein product, partial [Prorocentrum cordatum]
SAPPVPPRRPGPSLLPRVALARRGDGRRARAPPLRPPTPSHTPAAMDCDFDICRALGAPPSGAEPSVVRVDDASLGHPRWGGPLRDLLDALGERSKRAQGLGKPVTCGRGSLGGQRVYLLADGHTALGLLKVGPKRLYVARGGASDGLVEINPLCSLDFYVVEGRQRGGLGLRLFQAMLRAEGVSAERMAYDRPSPKFIAFLQKHFGLSKYTPQSNHFVVFDRYFSAAATQKASPAEGSRAGPLETPRAHRQSGPPGLAGTPQTPEAGPGGMFGQHQQNSHQGGHGHEGLPRRGGDAARGPPPAGPQSRALSTPTSGRPYGTHSCGGSAASRAPPPAPHLGSGAEQLPREAAGPAERPPQALDRSAGRAAAALSQAPAA